jgi:nucleotide-binding universal stress UspA family protein
MVGVDEHEGGRDAITLAKALVAKDGELTLAYMHHGYPVPARGMSVAYEAEEHERALELLKKAREEAAIEAELADRGSPSVGRGLHELADAHGADLVVVGSTRRGLFGRVFIGDDTRAALNGAPCAIAIAPAGYSQHPVAMREIGVGYDGSPESEHALGVARNLAAEQHTRLSAFEAVSLPAYMFTGPLSPTMPRSSSWSTPPASASQASTAWSRTPPTATRPRSWRSTAPRSTCWWSARAATARSEGSCTAAPRSSWRAAHAARCLC